MTDERAGLIRRELETLADLVRSTAEAEAAHIAALADRYAGTLRGGGTLYFAGNGGSAADAQHLAAEYAVRFRRRRGALAAIALTTDTSLITAAGNDLG
ncbi:MAG: SIS domain-containing protein, partial [Gemmatimonadales bacterium]